MMGGLRDDARGHRGRTVMSGIRPPSVPTVGRPRLSTPHPAPGQPKRVLHLSSDPPPIVMPTPRGRTTRLDLTGYWEAIRSPTNPNMFPPLLAQLSQAGGVVVLWFTRPPPGVEGVDPLLLPDVRAGGLLREWVYGVASAIVYDLSGSDQLTRGSNLSWVAAGRPARSGVAQDNFNVLDPSHLSSPPDGIDLIWGNGQIKGDGTRLTLGLGRDKGHRVVQVTLRKVRAGSRLPRSVLDAIPAPLQTELLVDTVRPIPVDLERRMLSLFAREQAGEIPRLASLLSIWHKAPQDNASRDGPRTAIGRALEFGLEDPWRTSLLDRMVTAAWTNVLQLGDETKTYAEWLTDVHSEEEGATRAQRLTRSHRVLDATKPFRTGSSATFAYTLSFTYLGASIPLGREKGFKAGITAGSLGVNVDVKKEAVALERDKDGHIIYDGAGRPSVRESSRRAIEFSSAGGPIVGVFNRIDTGLSWADLANARSGKATPEKAWHDLTDGGSLGSIEFLSSLDITGIEEFDMAVFAVSSVVLGQVKFGNWAKAQPVDSSLWELRLRGGRRLSAIVDADPFAKSKISSLLKPANKQWWKDWEPASVDITIFRISTGFGLLLTPVSWVRSRPTRTAPRVSTRDLTAAVTAELSAFFEYNSFALEDPNHPEMHAMPRRLRLEERLAEIRGVLALNGGPLVLVGMTSPEGDSSANYVLSYNRIAAVDQAIIDALGPVQVRGKSRFEPLGETPSKAAHQTMVSGVAVAGGRLPDPEAYTSRAAYFADPGRRRKAEDWPLWRRVDVWADGFLILRVSVRPDPSQSP